jgi:WD repeat-containing protein 26
LGRRPWKVSHYRQPHLTSPHLVQLQLQLSSYCHGFSHSLGPQISSLPPLHFPPSLLLLRPHTPTQHHPLPSGSGEPCSLHPKPTRLVLLRSQAEGNPSIFDLADHSPQGSPPLIASDHPESPYTTTGSTAADFGSLAHTEESFAYDSASTHHTGPSLDPLRSVDRTLSSETAPPRNRRRRRSDTSSPEPSDLSVILEEENSGRAPSSDNLASVGTRRAQRPGRAEGLPRSPKRRRLANMRPKNDQSSTTANGQSETSNGLLATSPRRKAALVNSLNGNISSNGSNGQSATNGSAKQSIASSTYFGHDREEVTRILIQGLFDLGYNGAAAALTRESGYELESPSVVAFRNAVLDGRWPEAENILLESFEDNNDDDDDDGIEGEYDSPSAWGKLALAETADKNEMLFLLRQQKFMELLEARDLGAALMVLRQELTPLNHNITQLHALSRQAPPLFAFAWRYLIKL